MLPSSRLSQLAAGLVISALSWTTRPVGADMAAGAYFVHKLPGAPAEPVVKMHAG